MWRRLRFVRTAPWRADGNLLKDVRRAIGIADKLDVRQAGCLDHTGTRATNSSFDAFVDSGGEKLKKKLPVGDEILLWGNLIIVKEKGGL
ncbi:hypothetical protein [Gorillibacterium timonense]|uniref:hypothetical protein n=1 Tax=Gorillibacterium timonense TaxID=1689269 RepID=UPI00071C92BF|nr:hypothetical protein [Gorillibacterium timonense]